MSVVNSPEFKKMVSAILDAGTFYLTATLQYPLLYAGLYDKVLTKLDKRARDIVTPLCLAACMVPPSHVYGANNTSIYNPSRGYDAIVAIIDRYHYADIRSQVDALKTYQDFREKQGRFSA